MARIIVKDLEPYFISKVPGRERVFLVSMERCDSKFLKADTVTYAPGAEGGEHYHKSESFIYIIEGECEIRINGTPQIIGKGTMAYLEPGDKHFIKNVGRTKMVMLEAFAPQEDAASIWTEPKAPHEWIKVERTWGQGNKEI
ncbi:MAG: cupin domain-containing protein [Nitrososphaerales archaeon]